MDSAVYEQILGKDNAYKIEQVLRTRRSVESVRLALREEESRHRRAVDALEKELAQVRVECGHPATRYRGDVGSVHGISDLHECLVCGAQIA